MSFSLDTLFNSPHRTAKKYAEQIISNGFLRARVERSKRKRMAAEIEYVLKDPRWEKSDKKALLIKILAGKSIINIGGLYKEDGTNKELSPWTFLNNHTTLTVSAENFANRTNLSGTSYIIGIMGENRKLKFEPVEKFFE